MRDGNENVGGRVSGGGGNLFRVIMVMEVMVAFMIAVVMVMQLMRVEWMVSLALTMMVIGQGPNGQGAMLMVSVVVTVLL